MKIPRLQYVIAALLFLATMINYLDRVGARRRSVENRKDFQLSDADYGHIVALFLVAYAIMYAGSGMLIDRLGTSADCGVHRGLVSSAVAPCGGCGHGVARGVPLRTRLVEPGIAASR